MFPPTERRGVRDLVLEVAGAIGEVHPLGLKVTCGCPLSPMLCILEVSPNNRPSAMTEGSPIPPVRGVGRFPSDRRTSEAWAVQGAKRVIRRPATMDRARFRPKEPFVGGRIGHARRHRSGRCGNVHRPIRLRSSQGLEWPGPCRRLGVLAPSDLGNRFAATKWTAGAPGRTAHADHHHAAHNFGRGRTRRLPRAPAPATPALTAAVAPSGPRDIPAASGGAGAVDLPRRGSHRQGHVDLGVGKHRRW